MRAVIHERYGAPAQVLRVGDMPKPVPGDREVLVRVRAASVHADVWHVLVGEPRVLRLMGNGVLAPKRKIPGSDFAGVVESVGKNVERFNSGDEVFGEAAMAWRNGGTYAEYAAVPEDALALKPRNVTFEQAGSVASSGYIALTTLQPDRIEPGHEVLVNGGGGNVGTLAIQIAKGRGARVTAVDTGGRLVLMRTLGADRVLDYAKEDVLERGERYDLVYDVASTLSLERCAPVLKPRGIYTLIGHAHYGEARSGRTLGAIPTLMAYMLRGAFGHPHLPKPDFKSIPSKAAVMARLANLMEAGVLTPVVGKTFALEDAIDAIRCLEAGSTLGRIVIAPSPS